MKQEHKEKLVAAYAQPWRKYHDGSHIVDMLGRLSSAHVLFSPEEFDSLTLAIWYHDFIYQIPPENSGSNEFYSAEHMYQDGYKDELAYGAIIATSEHFSGMTYTSLAVNFLLDIDIISFASEYEEFLETNKKIDAEYLAFLPYEDVISGRKKFLTNIFENQLLTYRFFYTKHTLEEQAYANLEQYLKEI